MFIHLFLSSSICSLFTLCFSLRFSFFFLPAVYMSMSASLLHSNSHSLCSLSAFSSSLLCLPFLLFSFFCPSLCLLLAANPERGRPFCGGRGKVDAMWPCRAASPHRAGPQPGVTDGFFLLFSSAVEHRHTWWSHPAAIQGGETTVTVQDQGVSCWHILNWMHHYYGSRSWISGSQCCKFHIFTTWEMLLWEQGVLFYCQWLFGSLICYDFCIFQLICW